MIRRLAIRIAEEVIHRLQSKIECMGCKNWASMVDYLKGEITHLRKEKKEERDEYKRTVDLLLLKNSLAPVGQGETPRLGEIGPSLSNLHQSPFLEDGEKEEEYLS